MTTVYVTVWLLVVTVADAPAFVPNIATEQSCEELRKSVPFKTKCIPYESVVGVGR